MDIVDAYNNRSTSSFDIYYSTMQEDELRHETPAEPMLPPKE